LQHDLIAFVFRVGLRQELFRALLHAAAMKRADPLLFLR
jgi:hypothetical protein